MKNVIKRIICEVDINLHAEVKKRAAGRNISMKTWVSRAIMDQIKKEQRYETQESETSNG